ncbi:MAG: HAD-IIIA family hydrolase [Eubacteriales bacterium]|nr:HAD-IIIA family hydrolase [Eubacteriales bacterium]
MKCLILCGGLGTRLRSVVNDKPKSMAEINNKPFLLYQIEYLKKNGFNDFILATGYKSNIIEEYFLDGKKFNINIQYSKEETPLGTAGAIRNALNFINENEDILIINGDTFFEANINSFIKFHKEKKSQISLLIRYIKNANRYGLITISNDNKVISWDEKKDANEGFINGGIYIINSKLIKEIPLIKKSLELDIIPSWLKLGKEIYAKDDPSYFIDIGIPQSLKDFIKHNSLAKQKIVFLDRDGTINIDKGYTINTNDLIIIPSMKEKMIKWKKDGYKLIVITNQSGVARGLYSKKDVNNFHKYLNEKIDFLIDGFYYCPYHKDGIVKEYKKESYNRKPNPGMLLDCMLDLESGFIEYLGEKKKVLPCIIDKENSFFVGDKNIDIECANRFGIKGYKVDYE